MVIPFFLSSAKRYLLIESPAMWVLCIACFKRWPSKTGTVVIKPWPASMTNPLVAPVENKESDEEFIRFKEFTFKSSKKTLKRSSLYLLSLCGESISSTSAFGNSVSSYLKTSFQKSFIGSCSLSYFSGFTILPFSTSLYIVEWWAYSIASCPIHV